MIAKFKSDCTECGGQIAKGEQIAKTIGAYGWQHAEAAACKDYQEFYAEAASEGAHWQAGTWCAERGYA